MSRGKRNSRGHWDARCLAHNGTGDKALVHFPSTGAVKCNASPPCDYFSILRAEGLPDGHLPSRDSSDKPEQKKSQTKKSKHLRQELFADAEPWPEPVNGSELLDEIVVLLRRYVDASEAIYHTAAVWTLFTHAFECFFILPILLLVSPTKRSGKTTLLQVLHAIVARPLATSSISAAALFRGVEAFRPTLLIDEADTFLNDKEDLGGIINSGHTKMTAVVVRVDEKFNVQKFSTFCPKLIAMIGKPKDTIIDRSIVLGMKRASARQQLEYLRADKLTELGASLRSKAARFAADNAEVLRCADPAIPAEITSARARDNWRSLLAVSDACGGEWPTLARKAAVELSGGDDLDNESVAEMLLADTRLVFRETNSDRLFSKTLVEYLIAMADRPWPEANNGKAITPAWLSRRLRPFSIYPKSLRIEPDNAKGYELAAFQEAFTRYLPEQGESNRHNVTTHINIGESEKVNRHNEKACDAFKTRDTRINIGLCRRDGLKGGKVRLRRIESATRLHLATQRGARRGTRGPEKVDKSLARTVSHLAVVGQAWRRVEAGPRLGPSGQFLNLKGEN